uniref:Condensin-2 complex subunit H2 n=1 Tax=Coturnix japonica TaxID=93934 RepID=A0A8C2SMB9_COTJA
MEDVESRFAHLLQPIRDLTKNWEVDVAAQLGEYLEELDQICISFDGGKTTMNFIEAALLIQGSACIYSKKVEYLYSLVYQALDSITNKNALRCGGGTWCRAGAALEWAGRALHGQGMQRMESGDDLHCWGCLGSAPSALGGHGAPIPLTSPHVCSRKGEILASRKDFRMNTCTPHTNGAFMLELAGLSPMCLQHRDQEENNGSGAVGTVLGGGPRAPSLRSGLWAAQNTTHFFHQEMLDPWRSLDPFGDSEDKPFRKGRPFLAPHGMDDVVGGKRKRKGPRKLLDFLNWFSATYNNGADCRKTRRKGPTFADLEALYWKQQQERLVAQRKLQSRMVSTQMGLEGGGSRAGWGLNAFPQGPPLLLRPEHEEEEELNAPEDSEGTAGAVGVPHPHTVLVPILFHIPWSLQELFIANSQRYVQETELSQHIRLWEEKMGPALQEQEERTAFDIHSYGDRLAARFGSLGQWQSFASLVAGLPPFEVCRYMLASLQLANDYTVEVAQAPGLEEAVDTVRLRLLTRERAHERFRTYMAPSACE